MASLIPEPRPRPVTKSAAAFRTISEVSAELEIPQHVLRFWETKFPQIRPLKRGGGRRYYRPEDVELLKRIQHLLYAQGYTIKGVQRLLREGGRIDPSDPAEVPEGEPDREAEPSDEAPAEAAAPSMPAGRQEELRAVLDELVSLRRLLRGA